MNAESKEDQKEYLHFLVCNKNLHSIKRIDYIGDLYIDSSYYEYLTANGIFQVHIPEIPIKKQDYEFIESYLDSVFGEYKLFIKKWLAVYCYTNYRKLPHLVFIGERGTSKLTFMEMVSSIFESLSSWPKDLDGYFNPDAEKKLVIIDEEDDKGKVQYKALKKFVELSFLQKNKKYI